MNLAIVDDICCCCNNFGGSQLNNWNLIQEGIKRKHKIRIVTPQNINLRSFEGIDLVLFTNIVNFPRETIQDICNKYPYIFFHRDFNFCNGRLFFCADKKCEDCINKPFWSKIYSNAKFHIWLSPLHREGFLKVFPELDKFPKHCIPSSIDIDLFKPFEGVERKKGTVLGINCLELFKGRYNIHNYVVEHPELHFTFIGQAPQINAPNCTYLQYIKNEELPRLMSQFEYFIHLPNVIEPCGRCALEAILCGCKIITNSNNGAFSYNFMKKGINQIKSNLKVTPLSFWEQLEIFTGELKFEEEKKGEQN